MISFANEAFSKLESSLNKLLPENSPINTAEQSIDIILQSIDELKEKVKGFQFETVGEEILFFKQIKPKFTCKLIYHVELIKIEGKRPIGSVRAQERYLTKQLGKLESYFDDNVDFYQYYRSGSTYLDEKYFVRNVFDIRVHQDAYSFDHDPDFSTSHDFKVGKILANEQLRNYLNRSLLELEQNKFTVSKYEEAPKRNLIWTAPKAALVELMYGLHTAGVFNHSNADIRQVAHHIQAIFNVDLGNYYKVFQEIRNRKSGRTNFTDQLKKKLIERMDETDG
jgi:hypothetical protein